VNTALATRTAERASAGAERAPLVYVTGGKGGVGKTVLSVNLCAALARRGARVLLADLDLGLADADVLLRHCSARNLADALAHGAALSDCVERTAYGFDLIAGVAGAREWAGLSSERRSELLDALRGLARRYDLVVADGSAGIGESVLAFAAASDHVLLVTTPDPMALTDAYGLLKALHERSECEGPEIPTPDVVVNRARDLAEAERTAARLRDVAERFLARSPRWVGWLPESAPVARSCRTQRPFGHEAGAGSAHACLDSLAARFARVCAGRRGGLA
jgi:flagellar biosynthesis protein FlhG